MGSDGSATSPSSTSAALPVHLPRRHHHHARVLRGVSLLKGRHLKRAVVQISRTLILFTAASLEEKASFHTFEGAATLLPEPLHLRCASCCSSGLGREFLVQEGDPDDYVRVRIIPFPSLMLLLWLLLMLLLLQLLGLRLPLLSLLLLETAGGERQSALLCSS